MIIVEGPDGSGKSTLIKRLGLSRQHLKALRAGTGSEGANPKGWAGNDPALLAYTKKVIEAYEQEQANPLHRTAFDRFHLSEYVYAPLLRPGREEIHEGELTMLTDMLRLRRIPVILCLPPFEVTLKNVTAEGRERPAYQTEEFLHQAYEAFKRVAAPWATLVYDFTRDELPRF